MISRKDIRRIKISAVIGMVVGLLLVGAFLEFKLTEAQWSKLLPAVATTSLGFALAFVLIHPGLLIVYRNIVEVLASIEDPGAAIRAIFMGALFVACIYVAWMVVTTTGKYRDESIMIAVTGLAFVPAILIFFHRTLAMSFRDQYGWALVSLFSGPLIDVALMHATESLLGDGGSSVVPGAVVLAVFYATPWIVFAMFRRQCTRKLQELEESMLP